MNNVRQTNTALVIASVLMLFALTDASKADLINGSFEINSGSGSQAVSHWTMIGSSAQVKVIAGLPSDGAFSIVFNGSNVPGGGVIWQDFATETGQRYEVSFDFRQDTSGLGPMMLNTAVFDGTGFGGPQRLDQTVTSSLGAWETFSHRFTAHASTSTIRFTDLTTSSFSRDAYLDHVRLSVVPEPSTITFLAAGLLGLACRKRKRCQA